MWILQYNGITLNCHHCEPIRREAVFAGPTYIHTKFRLSVQAIYNPALNAYAQTQPGVVVPAPAGAVIQAALTDVNLRHRLLQPRKSLVFTVAGIRQIVSPLPGYTVDANNGPVPMECSVTELHGTKTFFVSLVIDTWLNEVEIPANNYSDFNPAVLSPLLSHEWNADASLDQHFFETRVIKGRAVFRRDRLEVLKRVPDDYRTWLFHPLLNGSQRVGVDVTQHDEGVTFDYEIVDKQVYVSHVFNDVAEIQIQVQTSQEKLGIDGAITGLVQAGVGAAESALTPTGSRRRRDTRDRGRLSAVRGIVGLIGTGVRAIPTAAYGYAIHVWSNPTAKRANLIDAAEAFDTYFNSKLGLSLGAVQRQVSAEMLEPLVVVETKCIAQISDATGPNEYTRMRRLNDMSLGGLLAYPARSTANVYPRDGLNKGSRGTSDEAVIAAILRDTGNPPVRPEDQRRNFQQATP